MEQQDVLHQILERNARVEREKAWELSWTRRSAILLLTYAVAAVFLWSIRIPSFYLQALVPTLGYALSTLSLPWVKKRWMERYAREP